jgi:hypothetical protein
MGPEDVVLGQQVFIARQQFLIDQSRDEHEQARPMQSIIHAKRSSYPCWNEPRSGTINFLTKRGTAGSTVGWGFQAIAGPVWESAVSSIILTSSNPGLGVYNDFIGSSGGAVNGVTAPLTAWNQSFDAANGLGFGSFTIDAAAKPGDSASGTLEFLFETFTSDPNICSTCAIGFTTIDLPFSVVVTASTTPEPATFYQIAGGVLLAFGGRRPRKVR